MSSAMDIGTVPPELFAKFQTSFYVSPEDAVFKALGADQNRYLRNFKVD